MRLKFFHVPALAPEGAEAEVNRFLARNRVLTVERVLVPDGARSFWAVCVQHLEGPKAQAMSAVPGVPPEAIAANLRGGRADYRELLPEPQFQVFAALRTLRKTVAEQEGVPVYAVFSNEQLAEMVSRPVRSLDELESIAGVGPARRSKYGAAFLARMAEVVLEQNPVVTPATGDGVPSPTTAPATEVP